MNKGQWSKLTAYSEMQKRTGGRRRYNKERQGAAFLRWLNVATTWQPYGNVSVKELAQRHGVHPATIYRDIAKYGTGAREKKAIRRAAFERSWERMNKLFR